MGVGGLTYSPDGSRLAFGGGLVSKEQPTPSAQEATKLPEVARQRVDTRPARFFDIHMLDSSSLSVLASFASSHNGSIVRELIFTPDGKFLISGANAHSVAVHEMASGAETIFLKDFKQSAHPSLSRDGKHLAVVAGREIRIYAVLRQRIGAN
jgi:WD40 repeat protein